MMSLEQIVEEIFSIQVREVDSEEDLTNLPEWDSMTHMLFVVKMEQNFGIQFSGEEIEQMRNLNEIQNVLFRKGVEVK